MSDLLVNPSVVGQVEIDYTNWHGVRAKWLILPTPRTLIFGSSEWHGSPQWLFAGFDLARDVPRVFALSGLHSWIQK